MQSDLLKFLYANFNGRIGRKTFWLYYVLPLFLFNLGLEPTKEYFLGNALVGLAIFVLIILMMIAMISGFVKRLHDRGKSGWWTLLCFVPIIGTIYWIIDCGILSGDDTENEYGAPAPLQLEAVKNAKA